MASILALPQELLHQVCRQLELSDKVRLSTTCKGYRTQLSPEIFETIRFGNREDLAISALEAVEAHGNYTSRIEFTCYSGPEDELTAPSLPLAASKVLEGHLTPNLHTVRLQFEFNFDDGRDWDSGAVSGGSIFVFEECEDDDYVREEEQIWKWRALMKETWAALTANEYVRELILDDFIPKWTSTFGTDEFREFLSRLESATFNIHRLDDSTCWRSNTQECYNEYLENLDTSFFHHMSGLKHLHIWAGEPLGLEGWCHIPLPLKPKDLPVLQSLKLKNCFVCPEIVAFVQGHAHVLKSLDVKDCFSAGDGGGMTDDAIYWAKFFDGIYEANPSLTEFIAGGDNVLLEYVPGQPPMPAIGEWSSPFTNGRHWRLAWNKYNDGPVSERVHDIRQKLKASPVVKLFDYQHTRDYYSSRQTNVEENIEQFINGDDQRAYDRLMGLIQENAARQGNEHGHTG